MSVKFIDPKVQAACEAEWLDRDRNLVLRVPIERVIKDAPQVDERLLLEGIEQFHAERMARTPSPSSYPESPPWVAHTLAVDAELKRVAGLSDREMAIFRSLHAYLAFRGFLQARKPSADERCRCAYLPETDRGPVSISNTDDPLTHWSPDTAHPSSFPGGESLNFGGVGSGLHIDDEPEETFPLQPLSMVSHYAADVPGATQFLTRYCQFWGRCNIMMYDHSKRSTVIEKCSFKHMDVFAADPDGKSHISGMTCRDPKTVQGRHQAAKRQQYLDLFGIPADCADNAFWAACRKFENKLATELKALGPKPKLDDVIKLFVTPWPEGLNKTGLVLHPKQGLVGYTLQTHVSIINERKYLRWQRSKDGKSYPVEPEVFQY